jgi:hypothetical protein
MAVLKESRGARRASAATARYANAVAAAMGRAVEHLRRCTAGVRDASAPAEPAVLHGGEAAEPSLLKVWVCSTGVKRAPRDVATLMELG